MFQQSDMILNLHLLGSTNVLLCTGTILGKILWRTKKDYTQSFSKCRQDKLYNTRETLAYAPEEMQSAEKIYKEKGG